MKVKVVFNEETRRWRSSEDDVSFDNLVAFVKKNWGGNIPDNMGLTFVDEEGDQITITNDDDLEEALTVAREDCRTSLKISVIDLLDAPSQDFVVLGSEASQSGEDSDNFDVEVDEADTQAKPVAKVQDINEDVVEPVAATVDEAGETVKIVDTIEDEKMEASEDHAEDAGDEKEEQEEEQQTEQGIDWKNLAKSMLENEAVKAALPGMVDVIFNSLRSGDDLRVAIDLALASFPVIHEHEFIQNALPFLPAFLPRMAPAVPMLLLLGPEAVKTHIEGMIKIMEHCCSTPCEGPRRELDVTNMLKACCPNIIKLMEGSLKPGQGETVPITELLGQFGLGMPDLDAEAAAENQRRAEEEARRNGPTIHEGVTCDGCGKSPIEGARFKSAVIPDFDLCQDCADKGVEQHPAEYPMIKMNKSMQDMHNSDMRLAGLREFMGQFRRGRCGRGRGGRGRGRGGCPWGRWANNQGHGNNHQNEWAAERMNQWKRGNNNSCKYNWRKHCKGRRGQHGSGHDGQPKWKQCAQRMMEKHGVPAEKRECALRMMEKHCGAYGGPMGMMRHHMGQMQGNNQSTPCWNNQHNPHARHEKTKAAFIADVTIPDRSVCAPSQALVKTWKMRNTGKTAWDGVFLHFIKGDSNLIPDIKSKDSQNGSVRVSPVSKVLAGQTVDVSAHIQTPAQPGRYTCYFRLVNQYGERFGPKIWVDLVVQGQEKDALQRAIEESMRMANKPTKQQLKTERQKAKVERQINQNQNKINRISHTNAKKLDGLQRKLARKQQRLEKLEAKEQRLAEKAQQKAAKKVAKAAKKAAKKEAKLAKCSIVDESKEVAKKADPVVEQDEQKIEMLPMEKTEMPTEQPVVDEVKPFQYQNEFEMVQGMGFSSNPDVVRYLLVENKGDVTKVINTLLSSMS